MSSKLSTQQTLLFQALTCWIVLTIYIVTIRTRAEQMKIILQSLLNRGANIEAQLDSGHTALVFASQQGHLPVVEVNYLFEIRSKFFVFEHIQP